MKLKSAQSAVIAGLLVIGRIASSRAEPPAAPPETPAQQLTVAQSGLRFRLGPFFLGPDWVVMTLIIENERNDSVRTAAIYQSGDSGAPRITLSDGRGETCQAAEGPAGIAAVPDPAPAEAPEPASGSMTKLRPRSTMNISLRFPACHLSKTSRLSFSGEFALSLGGHATEVVKVPFWGIEQRTTAR